MVSARQRACYAYRQTIVKEKKQRAALLKKLGAAVPTVAPQWLVNKQDGVGTVTSGRIDRLDCTNNTEQRISNKRPCLTAESPASAAVGRGAECENCEKVTAVVACQQCECNFCSACAEQIHAFKAMKKHGLAAIGEGATPSTASVASNTPRSAQVAQPQPQPQPPPALDGFGFALQSVRVQHHRSQPQDGSAAHMAALRADREREIGLAERRDKEASEAYAEQMRTLAEIREEQREAEADAPACVLCGVCGSLDSDCNPVGCLGGHPVFTTVLDCKVPQLEMFKSGPDPIDELERACARKRYCAYQAVAGMYKSGKKRIKLPSCLTALIRLRFPSPTDTYVGFIPKDENWKVNARRGRAVVDDSEPEEE